ncbi:MAG TPA: hypothetical protein VGT44_08040 [Ktedonobacteraceae bacterium]|nr:hypothetical protein [Ktedonobacteraceae bacterium]
MSSRVDRGHLFRVWDADRAHQRLAGLASWAAFSARWRAHQGLPLLHPMDVQYLSPADFCNGRGQLLPPEVARRRFRDYVEAAIRCGVAMRAPLVGRRRAGLLSADLGFARAAGFARWLGHHAPDYQYGRVDRPSYEPGALLPQRPYGVPVASNAFATQSAYWLDDAQVGGDGDDDLGDDAWVAGFPDAPGW